MAREGITAAQVAQAADALVGEGKQPTIRGVRDRLGVTAENGKYRTLRLNFSPHIGLQWAARRRCKIQLPMASLSQQVFATLRASFSEG